MQKYGIIGFPLGRSFSPIIHNKAFSFLGINAEYSKIEVAEKDFEQRIISLKNENWCGLNITVPYKEKILQFLDEIEPISNKIGAINTVRIEKDGKWTGFNTDYIGFLKPIHSNLLKLKNCLIAGAGGAARAVAYGLLTKTTIEEMWITNRTIKRAQILVDQLKSFKNLNYHVSGIEELPGALKKFDLIVNTTSVGMGSKKAFMPMDPVPFSHKNTIVYDIIYNPLETQFLRAASNNGLQTINGLPMLIWQAAESFEIWTNKSIPEKVISQLFKELSTSGQ